MPAGRDLVVIVSGAGWVVRVAVPVEEEPEVSATFTPKEKLPGVVGVPDTMPDAFSDRPCGREPALSDHVYGGRPPVAARACEYRTFTVPLGSVLEIESGPGLAITRFRI